ncbi:Ty1/Copia family ribonuclease HI, partial [uncultured Marinobacter sp.]|uniref:Ty1/Copia family ribonuclease HI n=1 Tax=uncultured Marinobacter sp. TaxID=187379 RepID=UPI0025932DE2
MKKTKTDVRIIGADDLLNMIVMIDSAHAVHDDMRGHTGGVTSFGTGIVDEKSSKQKMNTRSSTETEHVGTSKYLPKPIFFELFMGAQGYKPHTILAKDNESEIRMLVNGKASCTSNSKHVAIKYFWCTDRIKQGNISVRHCPTERMVADYMSKPLQGKLFITFRNVIMGWQHVSTLFDIFSSTE